MFSSPFRDLKGVCPKIESSQNLIFLPFPGIQESLEVIKSRALRQRERMGDPFLVKGGRSRHLSL